jgi:hypothetical protein
MSKVTMLFSTGWDCKKKKSVVHREPEFEEEKRKRKKEKRQLYSIMFSPWLDPISPQRQRPILPPQTSIHPTRIAQLRSILTPPPHRRIPRMTMRALWRIRIIGRLQRLVRVRVDELLRTQLVALLQVQPARIAQLLLCPRVASPEGCRGGFAVGAHLASLCTRRCGVCGVGCGVPGERRCSEGRHAEVIAHGWGLGGR